jgi:branched-chain amino acid transport system permease protein
MYRQTLFRTGMTTLCLAGLAIYAAVGGYFASEIVLEIAILAIMAISLDIVAGFGGMHSLFQAALMGVAAYGYGAATVLFDVTPALAVPAALLLATAFGAAVGFVTARTSGIFFIMATLAFGQLAYNLIYHTRGLGGDDGLSGIPRLDLTMIGIKLDKALPFSVFALLLVLAVYAIAAGVMRSGFGRMLVGVHSNQARLAALGVNVRGIKTGAFAISSALAGVAGILAAQHTQFVSPELLAWTSSGEVLIVVILGGLATLAGPLVGAICFVLVKHEVSKFTSHWPMIVGIVLIAAVLAGGRGILGEIERRLAARQRPRRVEALKEVRNHA